MHQVRSILIFIEILSARGVLIDPCDNGVYNQLPFSDSCFVNNAINPSDGHPVLSDRELPEVSARGVNIDPCDNGVYNQLPFSDSRFVNNAINPSDGHPVLSDRELPEGWYRAGEETMPTNPPPLYSCGTIFPLWFDDLLPALPGVSEDNKKVCRNGVEGPCSSVYYISVKNCGGYFVYKLVPPLGGDSAYCFGEGVAAARPTYKPSSVTTTVQIDNTQGISGKMMAKCHFQDNPLDPGRLLYQVTWLFDNAFGVASETVPYNDISQTDITLDKTNIKSLGRRVSCTVVAKTIDQGPPGPAATSDQVFIGIEILTPIVKFRRGNTGEIRVRPTVGIGCTHSPGGIFDDCCILLSMVSLDAEQCQANVGITNDIVDQRFCSKIIKAADWNTNHSIIIQAREEESHLYSATYKIELYVEEHFHHPIWGNYRLPDVIVQIEEADDTHWSTKYCQAQDDPHYLTFDKRPYDFHATGVFTMYAHTTETVEVQIRQESCSFNNRSPHCTCGVAVRVGGDIFVIDRCGTKYEKKVKFTSCRDGQLSTHKETNSKYIMYTPLGTRITSVFRGGTFMTVQIFPSLRDVGRTKGMCGTLTNDCKDDFLKSDGTYFTDGNTARECNTLGLTDYQFRPDAFSETWEVDGANNLFDDNYQFDGIHWGTSKQLCICRKDNKGKYIDCSSSSVVTCNRETPVNHSPTCNLKSTRNWKVPLLRKARRQRRSPYIKSTEINTSVYMTEEEAIASCTKFMDESLSFKMCKDIPNVDPNIAINTCVLDILLTNSTQWMIDAREGIKGKCLAEVRVNATLQNETESGGASIAEVVKNISCINDCLGKGKCQNGSCVCEMGFGGGDCGIDLSIPPIIYGIVDSGLCDLDLLSCTSANLEGDGFTSEGNPTCRIKTFHITVNGTMQSINTYVDIEGDPSTLMTMFCPVNGQGNLTKLQEDPPFVTGYKLSVSNDGVNFGDEEDMYIFNSTYQKFAVVDGEIQFKLKEGYCFIDGSAYFGQTTSSSDDCRICVPERNAFEWSLNLKPECRISVANPTTRSESTLGSGAIAGIVVGAVCFLIIVTGIIAWKYKQTRPKRFTSRVSMDGVSSEKPTTTTH